MVIWGAADPVEVGRRDNNNKLSGPGFLTSLSDEDWNPTGGGSGGQSKRGDEMWPPEDGAARAVASVACQSNHVTTTHHRRNVPYGWEHLNLARENAHFQPKYSPPIQVIK